VIGCYRVNIGIPCVCGAVSAGSDVDILPQARTRYHRTGTHTARYTVVRGTTPYHRTQQVDRQSTTDAENLINAINRHRLTCFILRVRLHRLNVWLFLSQSQTTAIIAAWLLLFSVSTCLYACFNDGRKPRRQGIGWIEICMMPVQISPLDIDVFSILYIRRNTQFGDIKKYVQIHHKSEKWLSLLQNSNCDLPYICKVIERHRSKFVNKLLEVPLFMYDLLTVWCIVYCSIFCTGCGFYCYFCCPRGV